MTSEDMTIRCSIQDLEWDNRDQDTTEFHMDGIITITITRQDIQEILNNMEENSVQ